ncbi:MAG: gliding motility-associated C-terminal domain-containing protein [Cyclobacteriaceae bacterium]
MGALLILQFVFPLCPFIDGPYQIGIIAADDACSLPMTDTLRVTVNAPAPPNTFPYFLPVKNIKDSVIEGSAKSWPIVAKDADGNNLTIVVLPDHFVMKDAGMTFNYASLPGSVDGTFTWNAFCKNYEFSQQSEFSIEILVDDQDACNVVHYDTATLQLKVILPEFNPKLKIYDGTKTQELTNGSVEMNLGHVAFDVEGTDTNTLPIDTLKLSLRSVEGNVAVSGYNFVNTTGIHIVESVLSWDPTCSIFKDGSYDNNYTFNFLVENDHCKTPKMDTAYVKLRIKDIESTDKDFLPANVITTIPDHCNDFFAIDDGYEGEPACEYLDPKHPSSSRTLPNAPLDNCSNRFKGVKIYDRWGKQVFESTDRKFRWYGLSEAGGVYYYIINYTQASYKGSLTVIH